MHKGEWSWQGGGSESSCLQMGVLVKRALQLLAGKEGSNPGVRF